MKKKKKLPRIRRLTPDQRKLMECFVDAFHKHARAHLSEFGDAMRKRTKAKPDPVRDRAMQAAWAKSLNCTAAAIRRNRTRAGQSLPELRHYVLDALRLVAAILGRDERNLHLQCYAVTLAEAAKANDWDYLRALVRWHDDVEAVSPDPLDEGLIRLWLENPNLTDKQLASRLNEASTVAVRDRRLRLGLKKRRM